MKGFLLNRLARWVAGRLDGYKTIIGGLGLLLSGVVGLIGYMYPDSKLPPMETEAALTTIASGFAVLGIGGKIEKTKKALDGQQDLGR